MSIKFMNHVILSVGPFMQLMMGLTLNIDGLLDARSSVDISLCVFISKYKMGHIGFSILS